MDSRVLLDPAVLSHKIHVSCLEKRFNFLKKKLAISLLILYYRQVRHVRLVGQGVKTPPSHGGNRGSIPLRAADCYFNSPTRENAEAFLIKVSAFFFANTGIKHVVMRNVPIEVLAQSIASIAPSATPALVIPLVFLFAGNGTWLSYLFATIAILLVGANLNQYTKRSASPGSLYSFVVKGFGAEAGVIAGWALVLADLLTVARYQNLGTSGICADTWN